MSDPTLDCSKDNIRDGVATTTSGFSDMIVLDEFEIYFIERNDR